MDKASRQQTEDKGPAFCNQTNTATGITFVLRPSPAYQPPRIFKKIGGDPFFRSPRPPFCFYFADGSM